MLFEGWGKRFLKVSWLCVEGWIQLDVGIVSLGEILCFPCIPNTWLHNQNFLEVYKWEFKYHVGYPSNRHMIRYGIYHMFLPDYSASQSFVFVLVCGSQVASKSSVESIPFPIWCSHISMGILILLDHRVCHLNFFSTSVLLFKWIRSFQHPQDQVSVSSQRCLFHPCPSCLCFSHPPSLCFFKDSDVLIKYPSYWCEASPFLFSVNAFIWWFSWRF